MPSEVVGCEFDIANGEFFGGYGASAEFSILMRECAESSVTKNGMLLTGMQSGLEGR